MLAFPYLGFMESRITDEEKAELRAEELAEHTAALRRIFRYDTEVIEEALRLREVCLEIAGTNERGQKFILLGDADSVFLFYADKGKGEFFKAYALH